MTDEQFNPWGQSREDSQGEQSHTSQESAAASSASSTEQSSAAAETNPAQSYIQSANATQIPADVQYTQEVEESSTETSTNSADSSSADSSSVQSSADTTPTTTIATGMTQPTQTLPPLSDAAIHGSAATTSHSESTPEQPYRLAPQYGAYGPVPTQQSAQQAGQQSTQQGLPFQNQNAHLGQQHAAQPGQSGQQMHNGGTQPPMPPRNPFLAGSNAGSNSGNGGNGSGNTPADPSKNPYGGPAGTPKPRTASNVVVAVVAALVSAALCLGIGYIGLTSGWVKVPTTSSLSSIGSSSSSGSVTLEGGTAADWPAVVKKVSSSVVSITTQTADGTASGTGAIFNTDGMVVTNNHVVDGAQRIVVTMDNGDMYEATVKGTDTTTDLAVIQIKDAPDNLTPVEFADSDTLAAGQAVLAIGNPLGRDGSATAGIISALNRAVTVVDESQNNIVTNAIQIDAAINPGNSGGPTFDAAGRVIGINSSIATMPSADSSSSGSIGIGFAIPSNLVKRVAEEIIKDGHAQHVALGVTVKSGTVQVDGATRGGAVVNSVVSGSPAAEAGLRDGDTIVAFNGLEVSNNESLLGFVRAAALNSTAKLTVVRDGKVIDIDVTFNKAEGDVNAKSRTESDDEDSQQDDSQQQQQQDDTEEWFRQFFNR